MWHVSARQLEIIKENTIPDETAGADTRHQLHMEKNTLLVLELGDFNLPRYLTIR